MKRRKLKRRKIIERRYAFMPVRDDGTRKAIPGDLVIDYSVFRKSKAEKLQLKIAKSQVK